MRGPGEGLSRGGSQRARDLLPRWTTTARTSPPRARLGFTRSGDRWSHCLERTGKGVSVARSDDLTVGENERQIVSPVYQEVHRHDLADGPGLCLLLTGRLFQHHFSAAITLRNDPAQPGFLELDFDIADRCRCSDRDPGRDLPGRAQQRRTGRCGSPSNRLERGRPGIGPIELCVEPPPRWSWPRQGDRRCASRCSRRSCRGRSPTACVTDGAGRPRPIDPIDGDPSFHVDQLEGRGTSR